ncbi:hypothetical protein D3C77_34760 [compost metagenome]
MYIEGSYTSLLFGVSQQAPQERLPGQLSEQVNMTSDLVAGLRRRAPIEAQVSLGTFTALHNVTQYNTDLAGASVSVVVDTGLGSVRVVNDTSGAILANVAHPYLTSPEAGDIRFTTLDDAVWICNVDQLPTLAPHPDQSIYPNPARNGFFYINAGAYSKIFSVTITDRLTNATSEVTYTTPDGSSPAHAAQSTPEAIATALVTAIGATWGAFNVTAVRDGAYVHVVSTTAEVTLSSTSGSTYVRTSNAMSIRDVAELPARLPVGANNLICATGAGKAKVYYRWDFSRALWTEDAAWGSMQAITNTPLQLAFDGVNWTLTQPTFDRRAAGDSETNPNFKFLTDGITGMCSFQGRLGLLSNEYINLSASNNPLRFFRGTLSGLNDDDPIEVAAQGSLTAPYEHAVNFNKDLVLFSKRYQGIVPGGSMVTPRTANIALMTQYAVDTAAAPVATGRSIFFGAPRSLGFVGVHEMVPSSFADSQYVADDVTGHIPRYIKGPWRFLAASTTSNILIGGFQGELNTLIVHEYMWSGNEKVLHSWHKWTLQHPVVDAYFSGDVLMLLLGVGTELVLCNLNLQRGAGASGPETGRLDYFVEATCTIPGQVSVPAFMTTLGTDLRAFKVAGADAFLGQKVFSSAVVGGTLRVDIPEALVGDRYAVGYPFQSRFAPSPPIIKDRKDVAITTSRAVINRYNVSLHNSGQFVYELSDQARPDPMVVDTTPQRWMSGTIAAGQPQVDSASVIIPARLDMRTVNLALYTSDYYDMNVLSIEYGYRFNQRHRRA